jgi:hypothetical protein
MLLKLAKFFLYVSLFCVVVVLSGTFFPFIGGKYYFFRIFVELSLMFTLFWWAFKAPAGELKGRIMRFAKNPLFIAVTVFAAAFLLASLFAYDSHAAFWSNYERGEGGFQMLHYYAFFFLLLVLFTEDRDWMWGFRVSLMAAVLMILYGVGAAFFNPVKDATGAVRYVNPFGFIGPYMDGSTGAPVAQTLLGRLFSQSRFQGSLGNPAYVAPYLMFSIFYALFLWSRRKWENIWAQRISYGLLIAFFLAFFVASQTRGAFLGLVAAVFVFLLYIVFSHRTLRKKGAIALGALIILGGVLYSMRSTPFVQSLPGSRLLNISLTEQTAQTRFWTWNSAWKGFKERPVLGWGPENFSAVFDKYFDKRHYVPGQVSETWFDRAHSVIFDYLAETGFVGFLSYVAVFVIFYWQLFKFIGREKHKLGVIQRGLFVALPAGYLAQGLLLFDVLPIYINVFLFLAISIYFFSTTHKHESHS